jgi:6,7-dimethyl-8-ribityllumazine synthase
MSGKNLAGLLWSRKKRLCPVIYFEIHHQFNSQRTRSMGTIYEGNFIASGHRYAVVVSRWNEFITSKLLGAAQDTLIRHGVNPDHIDVVWVPGSFEVPAVAHRVATSGHYDGVICLGCLIRGGTIHFDLIASEATKGIAQAGMQSNVPVTFGVITTETIEQAIERAGTKAGNKGAEAALAAIEMVNLYRSLPGREETRAA